MKRRKIKGRPLSSSPPGTPAIREIRIGELCRAVNKFKDNYLQGVLNFNLSVDESDKRHINASIEYIGYVLRIIAEYADEKNLPTVSMYVNDGFFITVDNCGLLPKECMDDVRLYSRAAGFALTQDSDVLTFFAKLCKDEVMYVYNESLDFTEDYVLSLFVAFFA